MEAVISQGLSRIPRKRISMRLSNGANANGQTRYTHHAIRAEKGKTIISSLRATPRKIHSAAWLGSIILSSATEAGLCIVILSSRRFCATAARRFDDDYGGRLGQSFKAAANRSTPSLIVHGFAFEKFSRSVFIP